MGAPRGQWKSEDKKTRTMPEFNCLTDAAWFFPALTSLGGRRDRLLKYLGQETRNNATVEHLRSYVRDPKWPKAVAPTLERRRSMDFYLDAATLLPVAVSFNVHPDNDGNADLLTEVEFSDYQNLNGVLVPMRIRKYVQGSLLLDIAVSNVALNTRLGLAEFAVNPERAGR